MRAALLALIALAGCSRAGTPVAEGTVLEARDERGAEVSLRVDTVARDPKDDEGDVWLYDLRARDASGAWGGYCLPDREGRTLAIPLAGAWNARREYVGGDAITFACTNGAIAKCVRLGYKPWKGEAHAALHQACMHVIGADYCGDGTPHTREGTALDIWDRQGIQERDTAPGMRFEAAWGPRGAVYLAKPRYADPLAELVAACPDKLVGHTALDGELAAEAAAARFPEALIFTESFVQSERP
jgi:hypothetical protein